MITQEQFKNLTEKYLQADKELRDFSSQFIVTVWGDQSFSTPKKAMTTNDMEQMHKMREVFNKAHQDWLEGLQNLER